VTRRNKVPGKTRAMSDRRREADRYLKPEVVSRLANMALRARLIVEGFMAGMHRSPYHGFSAEFSEYRRHNPGESSRHVDWKLFAKSDRYFVKVFEDETNVRATLLIDRSGSMGFAGSSVTKLQYASLLAAALAFLMIGQRDAVGLALFDEKINLLTQHRSIKRHLHMILGELERVRPGTGTRVGASLGEVAERVKRRGLVIVMSDLMDRPETVISSLKRFRHRGHETIVFHILDPLELSLDYPGEARFLDMETGEKIQAQPWFLAGDYRGRVNEWTRRLEIECKENGIDYNLLSSDTPFDRALVSYLNKRRGMH